MLYYLAAAGLVLLAFFWGAGVSWLVTPRRWRNCWPLLALPFGFALQSAVVWVAGWLPVAGTDAYGRAALLLPLGLLVAAWRRYGRGGAALGATAGALGLTLLIALLAASPWAKRGGALTAIANGSCDAADYAAGARVLKEFLPQDRSGFIGQREVAGIVTVDNFHDHWRQLNHFTPAALLALNASILGRPVHELASVICATLLAALVPVTLLVARSVVRLRRGPALTVAALVGLGPVQNYAVYQIAMGQMLAAAAVGVMTWGGFELLRSARHPQRAWSWFGVLSLAWWLLLGSYAFFLVVALAPLAGAVGWWLLRRNHWRALWRALTVFGSAVLAASVFGWERMEGFALRWNLHDTVEYGWPIPLLRPDGWLGLVSSAELHPVAGWWGWPLAIALVAAMVWPWRKFARQDSLRAWTVAGLVGPVVAGYLILSVKGSVPGSNASYDAYKLLACFQPVLLAGLLWWWRRLPGFWAVGVPLAAFAAVWLGGSTLRARAASRPLVVTADLSALQQLEQRPEVHSVNILCTEMWPRLWANAFLLRKAQFFSVPTYEGRRPTKLRGEWNLQDLPLRVRPPAQEDFIAVNRRFTLVRATALGLLWADFVDGWYAEEQAGADRWRWSSGIGRILVTNPSGHPVQARLTLNVHGYLPGPLELRLEQHSAGVRLLDASRQVLVFEHLLFQPGNTIITLTGNPGVVPGDGDFRRLSFALHEFELHVVVLGK